VTRSALAGAVVLALVALLFLSGLGAYPLLDPDEARHAEVAREMVATGGVAHLFLPTLDFRPYREKPPGHYWAVALAYRALGVGEPAARVASALAALLGVVALYSYAASRVGLAAAAAAALACATSAGWFALARYGSVDMTLTACVTVGVLAGLAWLDRPPPRRPPLVPYLAAALGMLVKGPVALALVGGPLALAAIVRRPRPALHELGFARGASLVAVVAALVWIPVAFFDASYVTAFAATNVSRWTAASHHAAPLWYYAVWLPAMLLPWTPFAILGAARAWPDPARRPLVLWAAFVPAFLTLPRGKLAPYALSALVPFALLAGPELVRVAREGKRERALVAVTGLVVAAALVAAAGTIVLLRAYPVPVAARAGIAAVAVGWATITAVLVVRGWLAAVPGAIAGAMLSLYPLTVFFVAPAVAALHSERDAAAAIGSPGTAPVVAFAVRDPSLAFYLRAPVVYTSDAALARAVFAHDGAAFLVTSPAHYAEVDAALGERAHVWHATRRRRLYANQPRPGGEPNGSTNRAAPPSSSAIPSSRLYLAVRSERHGAPVLICPAPVATAKSAMNASSVSPERCETTER
jgi:4-amino-4-deoxy-L-arabinose transferase-like glycosyltransferase